MSKQKLMELAALSDKEYAVIIMLVGMAEDSLAEDPNIKAGAMLMRSAFIGLANDKDADATVKELYEKFDGGVTKLRESCEKILGTLGE